MYTKMNAECGMRDAENLARLLSSGIQHSALSTRQSKFRTQQSGASLIELVMFIIIISVALAGILLVMNVTTKSSADPLVRKQAIAAAYSLLEEIELQDFGPAPGVVCTALAPGCNPLTLQMMRAAVYHTVSDYNGFVTNGIFPVTGAAALAGLETYNVSVAVTPAAVASVPAAYSIAAGSAVQIDVTVTAPNNEAITATGYRAAY